MNKNVMGKLLVGLLVIILFLCMGVIKVQYNTIKEIEIKLVQVDKQSIEEEQLLTTKEGEIKQNEVLITTLELEVKDLQAELDKMKLETDITMKKYNELITSVEDELNVIMKDETQVQFKESLMMIDRFDGGGYYPIKEGVSIDGIGKIELALDGFRELTNYCRKVTDDTIVDNIPMTGSDIQIIGFLNYMVDIKFEIINLEYKVARCQLEKSLIEYKYSVGNEQLLKENLVDYIAIKEKVLEVVSKTGYGD